MISFRRDRPKFSNLYRSASTNLAFAIYQEFTNRTSQALTEALGMEGAVEALRLEWEHISQVVPLHVKERMGVDGQGFLFAGYVWNWSDRLWGCDQWSEITASGVRSTVLGCRFAKGSRALCTAHLHFASANICTSLAPEHEFVSRSCLNDGDDHCEMLMKAKSTGVDELISAPAIASILPPPLDEEEMILWGHSYMGAGWLTVVKTMVERLGPEVSIERLGPMMHQIGMEMAPKVKADLGIDGDDLVSVAKGLDVLNSSFLQKGALKEPKPSEIERTTSDCPLSGEPPEACQLFDSFYQGLVQGLNPGFEFVCSQRMSEGGDICKWSLYDRRKPSPRASDSTAPLDPYALLSVRYVKGDISDEEYEKKMTMLRKHHPKG